LFKWKNAIKFLGYVNEDDFVSSPENSTI
jgi:hypothetical protein